MQRLREKELNEDTKNAMRTEFDELCADMRELGLDVLDEMANYNCGAIIVCCIPNQFGGTKVLAQTSMDKESAILMLKEACNQFKMPGPSQ